MKTNIIAITGLSGTGKSTIAKRLSKLLNIPFIITMTTRPERPTEKNGVDYWFVDNESYKELNASGNIIANEEFKVAGGDVWSYGIRSEDLTQNDTVIMVLTPKGVEDLQALGFNVISFYILVDESIRLQRIRKRNDNQSLEEIKRRSREDCLQFSEFTPRFIIYNNDIIDKAIEKIELYLNEGF